MPASPSLFQSLPVQTRRTLCPTDARQTLACLACRVPALPVATAICTAYDLAIETNYQKVDSHPLVPHRPISRRAILAALFIALALPAVAAACGGDGDGSGSGRPRVMATTAVIGALTREVAGDLVDVKVLAPAGVDPHDYELTANDQREIDRAILILRHGLGFDEYLDSAVGDSSDARLVTVTEGIDLLGAGDQPDPHVWHDPVRVKVMVANIAEALAASDGANAEAYRANAAAYGAVLDDTDAEIRQLIDTIPAENRKIVTVHDSFRYFIDRYGLEFIGSVIPATTTASEPSARDLATLQDTIRAVGVKAIFGENSADPRIARQLANDAGIPFVDDLFGDSLGDPGTAEATVHGMLLANARTIAEALR